MDQNHATNYGPPEPAPRKTELCRDCKPRTIGSGHWNGETELCAKHSGLEAELLSAQQQIKAAFNERLELLGRLTDDSTLISCPKCNAEIRDGQKGALRETISRLKGELVSAQQELQIACREINRLEDSDELRRENVRLQVAFNELNSFDAPAELVAERLKVSELGAELAGAQERILALEFESKFAMKLKDLGFDERLLEEYRNQKMELRLAQERIKQLEQERKA